MTTNYETRPVSWLVGPVGVESYHEAVIEVRIQDETGGEFIEIIQSAETRPGFVTINPDDGFQGYKLESTQPAMETLAL